MNTKTRLPSWIDRQSLSWAFYDWANSAFTLVVITSFFPIIYRDYWAAGETSANITFHLATVNSLSSLVIIFLAPLIGAYADRKSVKKKLLGLFAYGLFTKWSIRDKWVPAIAIATPFLGFLCSYLLREFIGFEVGFGILILNGIITFLGLVLIRTQKN